MMAVTFWFVDVYVCMCVYVSVVYATYYALGPMVPASGLGVPGPVPFSLHSYG